MVRLCGATFALAVAFIAGTARADVAATCVSESERAQLARDSGAFLEAKQLFVACARQECPRVVSKDCAEFVTELERRIPSVVLAARDDRGNDLTHVRVSMDGKPFADELGVTAIPLDPGAHVFRFEAEGRVPVETKVLLRESEKGRAVAVVLPSPAAPKPAPVAAPPQVVATPVASTSRGVPALTWVLGGVAVAGGAAFGVLSVLAVDQAKELERSCSPRCSDDAIAPVETKFLIARISGGIGIAAALAAVAVYAFGASPSADGRARTLRVVPVTTGGATSLGLAF